MTREQKIMRLHDECLAAEAKKMGYDVMVNPGGGGLLIKNRIGTPQISGGTVYVNKDAMNTCMKEKADKIGLQ